MRTHVVDDEVEVGLERFDQLPDWLAAGMDPELVSRSLGRHVPALADGRLRLLACEPQRLRSKEDAWLARYVLTVAENGGAPHQVVLVGRLWAPDQVTTSGPGERTSGGSGADVWRCFLPELRLELQPEDRDPGLPSLQRLTDPDEATALLGPILRAAGYEAEIASCWPEVVRYKPGSRCTVVVHLSYGPAGSPGERPPEVVVLKTHQGDKGRTAWNAMTALWECQQTWRGLVTLAQPLGFLPDDRILVQGPVPEERTLKELCREAFADGSTAAVRRLRTELERTARALAGVHASPVEYGRTASFEGELDEVREVVARLSTTVPGLEEGAAPLVRRLAGLSAAYPADPVVPAHHDFRPAQVLLHEGRLGFIDFDGASMAEPALDLGRFRAKLRDIGVSTLIDAEGRFHADGLADNVRLLDDLCEDFLAAYQERAAVTRQRVLLWEICDLFTAVLHAWTKVRLVRLEPRLAVLRARLASTFPG